MLQWKETSLVAMIPPAHGPQPRSPTACAVCGHGHGRVQELFLLPTLPQVLQGGKDEAGVTLFLCIHLEENRPEPKNLRMV